MLDMYCSSSYPPRNGATKLHPHVQCAKYDGRPPGLDILWPSKSVNNNNTPFPFGHPRSIAEAKRVNDDAKYRQLPCRTFISIGTCPYRERCDYLHDPRIIASNVDKLKTPRRKNKEDIIYDALFWPIMPVYITSAKLDNTNKPAVFQEYNLPFPQKDEYQRHDESIYSLWMHFVTVCSHMTKQIRDSKMHRVQGDIQGGLSDPANTINSFTGRSRLTVFIRLGHGLTVKSPTKPHTQPMLLVPAVPIPHDFPQNSLKLIRSPKSAFLPSPALSCNQNTVCPMSVTTNTSAHSQSYFVEDSYFGVNWIDSSNHAPDIVGHKHAQIKQMRKFTEPMQTQSKLSYKMIESIERNISNSNRMNNNDNKQSHSPKDYNIWSCSGTTVESGSYGDDTSQLDSISETFSDYEYCQFLSARTHSNSPIKHSRYTTYHSSEKGFNDINLSPKMVSDILALSPYDFQWNSKASFAKNL